MQLKEGKWYLSRGGDVRGPLIKSVLETTSYPFYSGDGSRTWAPDGTFDLAAGPGSAFDLVAEFDTREEAIKFMHWQKTMVGEPPVRPVDSEARKDDGLKLPLELLPPDALEAIAEILAFGKAKYGARNWEKGMAWSRPFGACLRHLFAWWRNEPRDAETGKSHLWHAGCCILFLIAYEARSTGTDDRPQGKGV